MIIVLTGAPGAGKGTQADRLVAEFGWRKLSTGDALRKHTRLQTEVGKVAAGYMNEGRLVPDDILVAVLKEELAAGAAAGSHQLVLLDGFPRTLPQAESLRGLRASYPVLAAIHLDTGRQELVERLAGRRTCSQCGASYHVSFSPPKQAEHCDRCGGGLVSRSDDEPAKIAVRLDVYDAETSPVLDFYREAGLYRHVDGNGSPDVVYKRLRTLVSELTR